MAVFYPNEPSGFIDSGPNEKDEEDDSDGEISEMKSLVAALRQECDDLKKRQIL